MIAYKLKVKFHCWLNGSVLRRCIYFMKKVFAMLVALSLVVASVTMSVFAADVGS